jgi:8-oxo-dGTP diphosphatase
VHPGTPDAPGSPNAPGSWYGWDARCPRDANPRQPSGIWAFATLAGVPPQASLAARFPLLYARQRWEWAGIDAVFSTELPPDELVTNVHVVGFVGPRIVVCRDDRGVWMLPGGTREAGESIQGCVVRELSEEAGARLAGPLRPIGAHHCVTDLPDPYRPWQPHPAKAWLWCSADVIVDSAPSCPPDAEQIVEVRAASPAEAQRLLGADADWLPELIDLAVELAPRQAGSPEA